MVESYAERTHTEHALLDIGEDIGALVIYTTRELLGKEIQVSQKGTNAAKMIHTAIWERRFNGQMMFAGIYASLPAGNYIVWVHPSREVTITGGNVTEIDIRASSDIYVPPSTDHTHLFNQNAAQDLLPPRYREGKARSSPMGSAPMRYAEDGEVAWDQMWTDFCDLALAGGAPHRGTLLEPVLATEVEGNQDAYWRVVAEIERGLVLVTGLVTVRSKSPGWVGLQCEDEEMALWMLRAIIVENVCVRREGNQLFFPAGPAFSLDKEIKNVITVVAKTYHYWKEHRFALAEEETVPSR